MSPSIVLYKRGIWNSQSLRSSLGLRAENFFKNWFYCSLTHSFNEYFKQNSVFTQPLLYAIYRMWEYSMSAIIAPLQGEFHKLAFMANYLWSGVDASCLLDLASSFPRKVSLPPLVCPCKARLTCCMSWLSSFLYYFQTWVKCIARGRRSDFLSSCQKSQMQQSRSMGY